MVGAVWLSALLLPGSALAASPGTITTIAGNPIADGPATTLGQTPTGVAAAPGGGFYVASESWLSSSVHEVSPSGQETTVAGDGGVGYYGDGGPATSAALGMLNSGPSQVAIDPGGDLLITDPANDAVRLVAAADCSSSCPYGLASMTKGDIYTVPGAGAASGVAVDPNGDLLTAGNSKGTVSLLASADCSSSCPYGLASMTKGDAYTIATAGSGAQLALDRGGDLLISDFGAGAVRLVAAANCSSSCPYGLASMTKGGVYTVAGTGTVGEAGDGGPATGAEVEPSGVAVDPGGDLLIVDPRAVRLVAASACSSSCPYGLASMTVGDIYTIAGNGTSGYSGDGGPATAAELDLAESVAVDSGGNLLIADSQNDAVRLVAASSCASSCPYGLASTTVGDIYTVAGNGTMAFWGDGGPATSAGFAAPYGVAENRAGDVLVADTADNEVRLIAAEDCSTSCPYGLPSTTTGDVYTIAGDGTSGRIGDGGPATGAELAHPYWVALDGRGDVLIADSNNNAIRLIAASACSSSCPYGLSSMTEGNIYTIASSNDPQSVALDPNGDLLIADSQGNAVQLVAASSCTSSCPYGLGSMAEGQTYTLAGGVSPAGYSGDGGPASGAQLSGPQGVAVDGAGDVLIADTYNNVVRLVAASSCASACPYGLASMTQGDIYTVVGTGTAGSGGNGGPARGAELDNPNAVTVDQLGDLLIADPGGRIVRLVAAANCASSCPYGLASMTRGDIYTVAGTGTEGFSGDGGPAAVAQLGYQVGIALDGAGDLLIGDVFNNRIRQVAFGPALAKLAVATAGSGTVMSNPAGIDCSSICAGDFVQGATVTLTATPSAGSAFVGWSGAGCAGAGTCTVTTNAAKQVTATFAATPPPPSGGGAPSGGPPHTGPKPGNAGAALAIKRQLRRAIVRIVVPHRHAARIRRLLRHGYRPRFFAPRVGLLRIRWFQRVGRRHRFVTVAWLRVRLVHRGWRRVRVRLTRRGRRLLGRARGRLRLTARASFAERPAGTVTVTRRFVLRR